MDITKLFCDFDDFCKNAEQTFKNSFPEAPNPPAWPSKFSLSEVVTILILYHNINGFRNLKSFYKLYIETSSGKSLFPDAVSYSRFVELIPLGLIPLMNFMNTRIGFGTGISFVDSTKIVICNNKRIHSNKVFNNLAARGKSTMGWFYGFKLHLIINEKGEILACKVTPGNVDDRKPIPKMTEGLTGKLFGDKGYISAELTTKLLEGGLQLITPIKKNMQNKFVSLLDKIILRKRSIIETINDLLKNNCNIDHSRHRSPLNFMVNMISGLIAYTYREKLPSINFSPEDRELLNNSCSPIEQHVPRLSV
jgi:hypothetical protein